MAEEEIEHRQRGLFHHEKKKEEAPIEPKNETNKHNKRLQHVGETVAATAAGIALHEKMKTKTDPEHARRHKIQEKVALAVAAGAGKVVLHEHHKGKEAKQELKKK